MAKEVAGSITTAVAGAAAEKAVSMIIDSLGKQTPVADKLQRLERLCMRVRSTVVVSEKHDIESASLLQWRESLREAVALGGEALLSFQQQLQAAPADAQGTTSTGGIALFSTDEDATKLQSAVEALEKASENLGEFIGLLQLEASPRLKRRRRHVIPGGGQGGSAQVYFYVHGLIKGSSEVRVLVGRLQEALAKISTAVDTAKIRDVEGMELEWLAQWAVFLREAREQGRTVLHALRAQLSKENPECGPEVNQLGSFVHTIESIAGDLEFFNRLIITFCDFPAFSSYGYGRGGRDGRGGRWYHQ
ncbi:hypothetical protein GQ55_9G029300 [Panicum hallii var. hallii]|uniref:Rx N-terminal domain-containing protein n=1 Tax=Panicum hallii var. hallii TaxID=1504633 RepID=A0A2T7BZ27_9POAL|nr:hypothetical protein GQ55_9G029300 [Panicum hallii var. hallii]